MSLPRHLGLNTRLNGKIPCLLRATGGSADDQAARSRPKRSRKQDARSQLQIIPQGTVRKAQIVEVCYCRSAELPFLQVSGTLLMSRAHTSAGAHAPNAFH